MNHSIEPRAGIGLMSAACSLLLLSAAPLRAAQDGDPVGKLEEIVVTANRTGTPRESVGMDVRRMLFGSDFPLIKPDRWLEDSR